MEQILRLISFLPNAYVGVVFSPGVPLLLAAIPVSGILALLAGIVLAVLRKERAVSLVFVPLVLSHAYLAGASMYFAGKIRDTGIAFWTFAAIEAILVAAMIWLARSSRLAAGLVGWFAISYALASAALTGMVLTGNWP